jgi:hypothetical protein
MKMASDVDQAEKRVKNPSVFQKLKGFDTVQQEALQVYAAKKKLEAQRAELKQFLNMSYGPQAWADLIQLEGRIRKERQEAIYKQQELRQQILEGIVIGGLCLTAAAILIGFIWLGTNS